MPGKFASNLDRVLFTYCAGDNDWHTTGVDGYQRALTSLSVGTTDGIEIGAFRRGVVSCVAGDPYDVDLIVAIAELTDTQLSGHWVIEEDNDGFVSATPFRTALQAQMVLDAFDAQWDASNDPDDDDTPTVVREYETENFHVVITRG